MVKRVNAERVKEFAKNLQEYNKQVLQQQRKVYVCIYVVSVCF